METAQDIYTITIKQIELDPVLDSWTITIKQNVRFQERMHLEKIDWIKFKMALYQPLFTFTCLIFCKLC